MNTRIERIHLGEKFFSKKYSAGDDLSNAKNEKNFEAHSWHDFEFLRFWFSSKNEENKKNRFLWQWK